MDDCSNHQSTGNRKQCISCCRYAASGLSTSTGELGWCLSQYLFGAWFGRVLLDTEIASTIIRKSVELGGDNSALILVLVSLITGIIFTSLTGAGPVISIAVVVPPILFSIGIPKGIALFFIRAQLLREFS